MSNIIDPDGFFTVSTVRALREVAQDFRSGVLVHRDVHTFADLHDFVDANGYGFFFEVSIDHGDDLDAFVTNAVQHFVSGILVATDGCSAFYRIDALERAADDLARTGHIHFGDRDPDDVASLSRFTIEGL